MPNPLSAIASLSLFLSFSHHLNPPLRDRLCLPSSSFSSLSLKLLLSLILFFFPSISSLAFDLASLPFWLFCLFPSSMFHTKLSFLVFFHIKTSHFSKMVFTGLTLISRNFNCCHSNRHPILHSNAFLFFLIVRISFCLLH